jgi:PIN domain nuclease of toxin-antitoxin system
MKELFDGIPRAPASIADGVLLDTCFLFYMASHQKLSLIDELAKTRTVLLSTFNAEEILLKSHQVDEPIKEQMRHWLKHEQAQPHFQLLPVDVHPGDWLAERAFVKSVNPDILARMHDASDAVLFAQAIQHHCDILTKDKHHLFTEILGNFAQHRGIKIEKDIHDL